MTIRLAMAVEKPRLEEIMRRASMVHDAYREQLSNRPDLFNVDIGAIADGRVWLEEKGGVIRAFANWSEDGQIAELDDCFVAPEEMGKDIGRSLVKAICDQLMQRDLTQLCVICGPQARPFYEALGFRWIADCETEFGSAARLALDL